jgi:RNA polymerase sigma-70 factor, ECF subfamily
MSKSSPAEPPDDMERTDVLLGQAKSGSQDAWKRLFQRYHKMLLAHVQARIRGLARRRQDAEDLLQAGFLRAWQKIESFVYEGEGSFRRWLATVVVHTCLNELEKRRTGLLQSGSLADHDQLQAQQRSDQEERRVAMIEAMGGLDEEDRDVLIQRVVEELGFEEIGKNLGCSREKARERYAAATERLARRVGA